MARKRQRQRPLLQQPNTRPALDFPSIDAKLRAGEHDAAIEALQAWMDQQPTTPGVVERLALALRQQERWPEVRTLLLEARNRFGLWPQGSDLLIGQALLELGETQQAAAYLQQASQAEDAGWAQHFLGKALRQLGQLEEALEQQRLASEALEGFVWAPFEAAQLLQELGQPLEALVEAEEAQRRCGERLEPPVQGLLDELKPAQAAVAIDELLEAGDREGAFVVMRQELLRHPADPLVRERARMLVRQEDATVEAIPLSTMEEELQDFELLLDAFEAELEQQGY